MSVFFAIKQTTKMNKNEYQRILVLHVQRVHATAPTYPTYPAGFGDFCCNNFLLLSLNHRE